MAVKAKVAAVIAAGVAALAAPLIMKWEGVRYMPYQDIVGVWTVCYGHTGADVVPGKQYTAADCKALLERDMAEANEHVRRCINTPMLRQIEAALTSATFNLGPKVVCGSTLQRKALSNDWPGACAELDLWRNAGGREVRGLVLRRADERALCEGASVGSSR
ncbi:lysozyme [[Pseudomonas] boreopolis]|uniref:Lysozyme n=1 Tax=Xanthomonas boreopolis TaxID=86183 RepID=A0A919F786_9XANT|nr:lysozyme [[Pseudomonas] boreopolis]